VNKENYFIVNLVVYPFDIMFSIDETDEVLFKRLKKYKNTQKECESRLTMSNTVKGRTVMLQSNQTIIRLRKQRLEHSTYGTLSHEIFHAITFILDKIGMTFNIDYNDEGYAYLIEYVTKEAYKNIKENKRLVYD
jgi:hypothetical protein